MELQYLDFEYSEDEEGNGTWDAMASVRSDRWHALLDEVRHVLNWASKEFRGNQAPLDEGGDWDYDLSAQDDDNQRTVRIQWSPRTQSIDAQAPQAGSYTTLTLTLIGNTAFGDALRQAFRID